jgi:hypothetical protein
MWLTLGVFEKNRSFGEDSNSRFRRFVVGSAPDEAAIAQALDDIAELIEKPERACSISFLFNSS